MIDFCSTLDGESNWEFHVMDHFAIFHILLPIKSKQLKEPVVRLKERVFDL